MSFREMNESVDYWSFTSIHAPIFQIVAYPTPAHQRAAQVYVNKLVKKAKKRHSFASDFIDPLYPGWPLAEHYLGGPITNTKVVYPAAGMPLGFLAPHRVRDPESLGVDWFWKVAEVHPLHGHLQGFYGCGGLPEGFHYGIVSVFSPAGPVRSVFPLPQRFFED